MLATRLSSNAPQSAHLDKPNGDTTVIGISETVVSIVDASILSMPTRSIYRAPIVSPQMASANPLDRHLREELEYTRRTLEVFARELSNDPILQTRYKAGLQSLRVATQTLGHIAQIVGSENKAEAVVHSSLKSLNARLLRGEASMLSVQDPSNLQGSASTFVA